MYKRQVMIQDTQENDMMMLMESMQWGQDNLNLDSLWGKIEKKLEWGKKIVEVENGYIPVIFTPKSLLVLILPLISGPVSYTHLNKQNFSRRKIMQDMLTDILSGQQADYVEVRMEEHESTNIRFQGENIEKISSSQEKGGNVRALVKGGWGFVTFNRWEDLKEKVKQAVEMCIRDRDMIYLRTTLIVE